VHQHLLINEPEIEHHIETGIEQNRKGWEQIKLITKDGAPIQRAQIKLRKPSMRST
jgi:hypothetical protein